MIEVESGVKARENASQRVGRFCNIPKELFCKAKIEAGQKSFCLPSVAIDAGSKKPRFKKPRLAEIGGRSSQFVFFLDGVRP
jgi:hypothetical protein